MKAVELSVLAGRLNELAEYYDRKPPSAAALKIWLDALSECWLDDVLRVLSDWPKTRRAMPLADEVLQACRKVVSDRIEAEGERNRKTQASLRDFSTAMAAQDCPQARVARQLLAEWARRQRNMDARAWAKRLRDREQDGLPLLQVQQVAWRAALREAA